MSDEALRKMQTRATRRSALVDISNKTSQPNQGAAGKGVNAARSKRMRASLEGPDDDVVIVSIVAAPPTTSSSSSNSIPVASAAPVPASAPVEVPPPQSAPSSSAAADSDPSKTASTDKPASKKRRSSDTDAKQEYLPPHVIRRAFKLPSKSSDPAQCLDIIDQMYQHYYNLEDQYSAKPYLARQSDINAKMRSILIDWLVEVHHKFKLLPQTLWLCVNILDRYLERVQTARAKLQLVGVTSLLIACKYEEIYPPEVRDCVYITDYAYEKAEVLTMETAILGELNYQICIPTGYHFLARYLNSIQASERTRNLAHYYSERNLQESDMLIYQPHKFAAASLYAALKQQNCEFPKLRNSDVWCRTLEEESGLKEADLLACARTIVKHVDEETETASKRKLIAAKKKYGTDKFAYCSNLPLPTI